jgi:hypothetical protein
MSWQELIQDPEFQQQPYEVKRKVAENYFRRNIVDEEYNKQSPDIQNKVFSSFIAGIGTPPTPQKEETGFWDRVGKSFTRTALENIALSIDPKMRAAGQYVREQGIPEQYKVPEPEKLASKETLAELIGTGIADLPAMLVSGGVGEGIVKKLGLKGAKAFIAKEALSGAAFSQFRDYKNDTDRLKGMAEESAAWVGFGVMGKGLGKTYKYTLGKLVKKIPKMSPEKAGEIVKVIESTNQALANNDKKGVRKGIKKLSQAESFAKAETYPRAAERHGRTISKRGIDVTKKAEAIEKQLAEPERVRRSLGGKQKLKQQYETLEAEEKLGKETDISKRAKRKAQESLLPATVEKKSSIPRLRKEEKISV